MLSSFKNIIIKKQNRLFLTQKRNTTRISLRDSVGTLRQRKRNGVNVLQNIQTIQINHWVLNTIILTVNLTTVGNMAGLYTTRGSASAPSSTVIYIPSSSYALSCFARIRRRGRSFSHH